MSDLLGVAFDLGVRCFLCFVLTVRIVWLLWMVCVGYWVTWLGCVGLLLGLLLLMGGFVLGLGLSCCFNVCVASFVCPLELTYYYFGLFSWVWMCLVGVCYWFVLFIVWVWW